MSDQERAQERHNETVRKVAKARERLLAETVAERDRLRAALERISSVRLTEPPPITDPDWMARLMRHIAREALLAVTPDL